MIARLSFTDFNGDEFMKNISNKKIRFNSISKFAPKLLKVQKDLKHWSESNLN